MEQEKQTFKALMVKEKTHQRVVVKAKQLQMTVDEYILSLISLTKKNILL